MIRIISLSANYGVAALEHRSCEPVIGVDKMHYANIAHPHYIENYYINLEVIVKSQSL